MNGWGVVIDDEPVYKEGKAERRGVGKRLDVLTGRTLGELTGKTVGL